MYIKQKGGREISEDFEVVVIILRLVFCCLQWEQKRKGTLSNREILQDSAVSKSAEFRQNADKKETFLIS